MSSSKIHGRLSTSVYWTLRLTEDDQRLMYGPVPALGEKVVVATKDDQVAAEVTDVIWVYGSGHAFEVERAEVVATIIEDPT